MATSLAHQATFTLSASWFDPGNLQQRKTVLKSPNLTWNSVVLVLRILFQYWKPSTCCPISRVSDESLVLARLPPHCHRNVMFSLLQVMTSTIRLWVKKWLLQEDLWWSLQIRLWSWWIRDSWWWQPRWALDEAADRESLRLGCCELTWPGDTAVHVCTRTVATKLGVEQRVESKVSAPLHPTSRGNDLVDVRSDEHSARECLPGSTKESLVTLRIRVEEGHVLWSSGDRAVLKYKPSSLAWIRSSLQDR